MTSEINLFNQPKTTLFYFFSFLKNNLYSKFEYIKYFFFISSFLGTYFTITNQLNILQNLNFNVINFTYWFCLGIMSSIGLGFGIHTGFLILFPLIVKVALFSIQCGNTNFTIYGDNSFQCLEDNSNSLNISNIYAKIFLESFSWALGTACGEIPPYLVSRFDRLNRSNSVDFSSFTNNKFMRFMNKITVNLLLKYRFWAILFLSSYPNMAFDLCGIASGHYLIPFKEFLSATIIGKAFIKTPIQCILLIKLFTGKQIEKTILKLPNFISHIILELVNGYKLKLIKPEEVENEFGILAIISFLWNTIIVLLILYFFKSIIDTMANNEKNKIK